MPARLTVDEARRLPYKELVERVYGLLEPYEAPVEEMAAQREHRIGRTLDEVPDVHAWFLTLHAYFDHWTDIMAEQAGQRGIEFKLLREKRDLCDNAARAARLRYEGASRLVTQMMRHEEGSAMRHSR